MKRSSHVKRLRAVIAGQPGSAAPRGSPGRLSLFTRSRNTHTREVPRAGLHAPGPHRRAVDAAREWPAGHPAAEAAARAAAAWRRRRRGACSNGGPGCLEPRSRSGGGGCCPSACSPGLFSYPVSNVHLCNLSLSLSLSLSVPVCLLRCSTRWSGLLGLKLCNLSFLRLNGQYQSDNIPSYRLGSAGWNRCDLSIYLHNLPVFYTMTLHSHLGCARGCPGSTCISPVCPRLDRRRALSLSLSGQTSPRRVVQGTFVRTNGPEAQFFVADLIADKYNTGRSGTVRTLPFVEHTSIAQKDDTAVISSSSTQTAIWCLVVLVSTLVWVQVILGITVRIDR